MTGKDESSLSGKNKKQANKLQNKVRAKQTNIEEEDTKINGRQIPYMENMIFVLNSIKHY